MKHTVYILESEREPGRFYTGITADLEKRLRKHNEGGVAATREGRPWRVRTFVVFDEEQRARDFERYLKSGSGRAFARKRF